MLPADGEIPLQTPQTGDIEEAAVLARRTLSGVQKKLLVYRNDTGFHPAIARDDPATHIAKFNQADEPTLVQNEDLSLCLAREILGAAEVTGAAKGVVAGFEGIALLVERFDRDGDRRLRLEDFAQILEVPHGRDFSGKYESSYEEAAQAILKHSARARIDLQRYFALVTFNILIGNADAHLKNFSLLETKEGLRLSPAYDLLCTRLYPFNNETALAIGGAKRALESVDRKVLLAFADAIGLPARAAVATLDTLARRTAAARCLDFAPRVEANDFRARYKGVVTEQAERIFA
ncbi:serine/threonine-protein kinase HipA [Sphingomonas sp. YR710]|uniref:type II toxin-antitoxin system HipA family toxin n=1 Tax=Sphingomonas sp. YR710 TaxID=1882773 RepID=UPI00088F96D5|nr:HipA domain-containing protein [Sphingomonas sp. YR710]SDC78828.1 serine/threonine-protein kinase HipA [Sphingomonas sp. YR710]